MYGTILQINEFYRIDKTPKKHDKINYKTNGVEYSHK